MKIKSIQLENDALFGDITIDLSDDNSNALDTIIIAGENGCGKTRLLNIIYEFSLMNLSSDVSSEKHVFDLTLSELEKSIILGEENITKQIGNLTGNIQVTRDFRATSSSWNRIIISYETLINGETTWKSIASHYLIQIPVIKSIFTSLYSTVEINYTPKTTKTITSKDLDVVNEISNSSGDIDLATEIKQLFIDIQNNDNEELTQWVSDNPGLAPTEEVKNIRIKRFKNAFGEIFDNLNYYKIITENDQKEVLFKKGSVEIPIKNLSSGEKQIVFRGAFLLRNQQSIKGNIVLIDEPEISLHPRWQAKILNFYRSLFTDSNNLQTSQIFIATHSPYIIHSDSRYNDKIIIFSRSDADIIIENNPKFVTVGNSALIEKAFNISNFHHTNPTIFVEGITDEKYIRHFLNYHFHGNSPYIVDCIGSYNGKIALNTGCKNLDRYFSFAEANPTHIHFPTLLLYDSDTNKPTYNSNNIHIRTIPEKPSNILFNKGIENFLSIPSGFDANPFYDENIKNKDYGGSVTLRELNKVRLCHYLCDADYSNIEFFNNFSELISIIEGALG